MSGSRRDRPEQPRNPAVKIEVLYVPGCPNHPRVLEQLRLILSSAGLSADIHEVPVTDQEAAEALRFVGSPTVRVDGQDVAPEPDLQGRFGLSCRLYEHGLSRAGVPSDQAIRDALAAAQRRD